MAIDLGDNKLPLYGRGPLQMFCGIFVLLSSLSSFGHASDWPLGHVGDFGYGKQVHDVGEAYASQFETYDERESLTGFFGFMYNGSDLILPDEEFRPELPDPPLFQGSSSPQPLPLTGEYNHYNGNLPMDRTKMDSKKVENGRAQTKCLGEESSGVNRSNSRGKSSGGRNHPSKRQSARPVERKGRKRKDEGSLPAPTRRKGRTNGNPQPSPAPTKCKGQDHNEFNPPSTPTKCRTPIHGNILSPFPFGSQDDDPVGEEQQPLEELSELCGSNPYGRSIIAPSRYNALYQQSPIQNSPVTNPIGEFQVARPYLPIITSGQGVRFGERILHGVGFKFSTIQPALRGDASGTYFNLSEDRLALEFVGSTLNREHFVLNLGVGEGFGYLKVGTNKENFHITVFCLEERVYRSAAIRTQSRQKTRVAPTDVVIISSWPLDLRQYAFNAANSLEDVTKYLLPRRTGVNPMLIGAQIIAI
jgi:translation initiation factor IF-1